MLQQVKEVFYVEPSRDYQDGAIALPPDVAAKVAEMTVQAEQDIDEARVNFRWNNGALATVKRAADLIGVPYQT